jgi:hypothetical protein
MPSWNRSVTCKRADGQTWWGSVNGRIYFADMPKNSENWYQIPIISSASLARYSPSILNLGTEWKLLVCVTSWFLYVRKKCRHYELARKPRGPCSQYGYNGEETDLFFPYRVPCRGFSTCRIDRYSVTLAEVPWECVKRNSLLRCIPIYWHLWIQYGPGHTVNSSGEKQWCHIALCLYSQR